MKVPKNSQAILKRTILFFVLLSIAIGFCVNWIVQKNLFTSGNFWIYGNKGKLIIPLAILFPFVIREKINLLPKLTWKKTYSLFGMGLIASVIGFFVFASKLAMSLPSKPLIYYLPTHVFLILIPMFLSLFMYGPQFLAKFFVTFKKEIGFLSVLGIIMYFVTGWVWNLWPLFSNVVLRSVEAVFALSYSTKIIPPDILVVESFRVRVGEECSGLESLFMFSTLYGLIGYFEKKTLNTLKYALTYIPLAIGLYFVNILRVYLLVLIGVLWSPELAVNLFHTYLGMVLFVIYFFFFLKFVYPALKK